MTILSTDNYIAATKQRIQLLKTGGMTTVAAGWFSPFAVAGNPGAGTLAGSSTAAGVVPTDATAGCPEINAFGGGATGYISRLEFSNSVACRILLFDLLFKCGAYAFNANTGLSAQPSFSGRLPVVGGNPDYKGTEIWVETVTAATGNQTWNVTYTDQDGNTGATTGAVGIGAAPTVGRCWQLPYASGDCGARTISNVAGGTGSAGTANILILRPLGEARIKAANDGDLQDFIRTGLPEIFADSALFMLVAADSTALGLPEINIQIANG